LPYIKVDVDKIREYQQEATKIRNAIRTISNDFSYIAGYLDSNVKSSGGIRGKLYNVESSLSDHRSVLFNVNTFLSNAAMKYGVVEKTLYTRDRASGDATYTDIDSIANAIATKHGLSINAVKEVVISGKYSIDEMIGYAGGSLPEGAFLSTIKEATMDVDDPEKMVVKRKIQGPVIGGVINDIDNPGKMVAKRKIVGPALGEIIGTISTGDKLHLEAKELLGKLVGGSATVAGGTAVSKIKGSSYFLHGFGYLIFDIL
jgi:hypothetical protein